MPRQVRIRVVKPLEGFGPSELRTVRWRRLIFGLIFIVPSLSQSEMTYQMFRSVKVDLG